MSRSGSSFLGAAAWGASSEEFLKFLPTSEDALDTGLADCAGISPTGTGRTAKCQAKKIATLTSTSPAIEPNSHAATGPTPWLWGGSLTRSSSARAIGRLRVKLCEDLPG